MKLQSTIHILSFILFSTLSACQVAPLGKADLFSTGYKPLCPLTQRTCWQQLSPRHSES